ncbi:uncharacterized protein METZ01_LOCUS201770 [marine metagenome]|uniref:MAPEG family protein n=1 Tax=marine metagenome TaxID=408172 RepID=A0A382EDP7_9ZZZZ
MTIAFYCVVVGLFIPVILAGMSKKSSGYNNDSPRDHIAHLSGKAKNAYNAEQNHYENFSVFAMAVVVAHWLGHDQAVINLLAIIFIIARVLHATFYITNNGSLRSLSYTIGFACTIALFFAG